MARVKKTEEGVVKAPKVAKSEKVVVKPAKKTETKNSTLSIDVYDVKGKIVESLSLPEELFGAAVNKALIAQAIRVYLANQRRGTVSTKTRGEVQGSSRKIYKQKGTGRARHGSVRAPIFVKGGIVFGPKPRDYSMDLPKKMRRKALFSALSAKLHDGQIKILSGVEKLAPKTKEFAAVLQNLELLGNKILFVLPSSDSQQVSRAIRNIEGVTYRPASQINTYEVLNSKTVVFMKDAVEALKNTYAKKDK